VVSDIGASRRRLGPGPRDAGSPLSRVSRDEAPKRQARVRAWPFAGKAVFVLTSPFLRKQESSRAPGGIQRVLDSRFLGSDGKSGCFRILTGGGGRRKEEAGFRPAFCSRHPEASPRLPPSKWAFYNTIHDIPCWNPGGGEN